MSIYEIILGIVILIASALLIAATLMTKHSRSGLSSAIGGGSASMEARKNAAVNVSLNRVIKGIAIFTGIVIFALSIIAAHI